MVRDTIPKAVDLLPSYPTRAALQGTISDSKMFICYRVLLKMIFTLALRSINMRSSQLPICRVRTSASV